MNLKAQNLILSILCVLLIIAVISLLIWMWFGQRIDMVDHQLKSLQ